ncbi:MAG: AAA family ATPase [Thiobacillus sp.]|nr:AAA family ATPase [Thiobacillus sp.]
MAQGKEMIKSISVHNYKSFHPTTPAVIPIDTSNDKPVIFFGLNGAGKSAIGEVIDGLGRKDARFAHCSLTPTNGGPFRYLVYNHAFVERVIGEPEGMPGIFTLGEVDTEAQKSIDEAQKQLNELGDKEEALNGQIGAAKKLADQRFETGKDRVWKAHTTYATSEPMWGWLQGYHKDKTKFYEKLQDTVVGTDEVLDTLDQLKQRWSDADSTESAKLNVTLDSSGFSAVEADGVWAEHIVGSGASRLAALIDKLGNGDWVGAGRKYARGEDCPFCQQGLPADFKDELAKLLDGDRQTRVDHLQGLVEQYAQQLDNLRAKVESAQAEPFVQKEPTFKSSWEGLRGRLQSNLAAMRGKLEKPGEPIVLESCTPRADELGGAVQRVNERIAAFNARVTDRAAEKERVKAAFWKLLRRDREEAFVSYEQLKQPAADALKALVADLAQVQADTLALTNRLVELRQSRAGVDAAVQAINRRLQSLGIESFSIDKKPGENSLYRLVRPGQDKGDLKSLSEGEKTLISFLYYIVLLSGSETAAVDFPLEKTIAVIDDPISSLSHNYVFDIASILQHEVIKPPQGKPKARQVIILTHNLFFLHELLNLGNKGSVLLRVVKNAHTSVEPLDPKDLLNDYDALWQILRDARDGKVPKQAVPNTMRCILEHFLWFTQRNDQFGDALKVISERDRNFKPLERFLNRGSHQDGINLAVMDYGHVDVNYFLAKFQEVFQATGFPDHFASRMGIAEVGALPA